MQANRSEKREDGSKQHCNYSKLVYTHSVILAIPAI